MKCREKGKYFFSKISYKFRKNLEKNLRKKKKIGLGFLLNVWAFIDNWAFIDKR